MAYQLQTLKNVSTQTGLSKSTLYRLMDEGLFPRPVRLSVNRVAWRASDVSAWIDTRPTAKREG